MYLLFSCAVKFNCERKKIVSEYFVVMIFFCNFADYYQLNSVL